MLPPDPPGAPLFWMNETSGALRPTILAYLDGSDMTPFQVVAMRSYLRKWISAPLLGDRPPVRALRMSAATLSSRDAIARWLRLAAENGMNPL